ncbi:MAG: GNAT family N-acetyltransferase [Proteobacteria bacterium]|nr:GNAT family N-acetyltransferase [Pseudomonadota bacterium]
MTEAPIDIHAATAAELPQVISAVVAAFITDPISRFAWPTPHGHLQGMPVAVGAFAEPSVESGAAYVSADYCSAALWMPPGVRPNEETLADVFLSTAEPAHLADLMGTFEKMGQWHPDEPHWYLPMIGVEPHAQGKGLGGALLRYALARCDEEGLPAYLESSNRRNIPLYERHGFEAMGQIQVGAGPLVTPMLRRPRS